MEAEIPMLGETNLRQLRAVCEVNFGDALTENEEVTDAQLAALNFLIDSSLRDPECLFLDSLVLAFFLLSHFLLFPPFLFLPMASSSFLEMRVKGA